VSARLRSATPIPSESAFTDVAPAQQRLIAPLPAMPPIALWSALLLTAGITARTFPPIARSRVQRRAPEAWMGIISPETNRF
jgi:hypothetical protein